MLDYDYPELPETLTHKFVTVDEQGNETSVEETFEFNNFMHIVLTLLNVFCVQEDGTETTEAWVTDFPFGENNRHFKEAVATIHWCYEHYKKEAVRLSGDENKIPFTFSVDEGSIEFANPENGLTIIIRFVREEDLKDS